MKQQIAELQTKVKKTRKPSRSPNLSCAGLGSGEGHQAEIDSNRHETRDSLDRVADLLKVPRSRI